MARADNRRASGCPTLGVRTKIDLEEATASAVAAPKFAISAKTGAGVDRLLDALADLAEERMSSREPRSADA